MILVLIAQLLLNSYFDELVEDSHYYTFCFVRELLLLKDNALVLSNNVVFFRLTTLRCSLHLLIYSIATIYIALLYVFLYD